MRWVGHVARMGEERVVYRVLVGKPEGRRPLGRPRCRRVDNKYDGSPGSGMWVYECGNEPSGSVKCREFLD